MTIRTTATGDLQDGTETIPEATEQNVQDNNIVAYDESIHNDDYHALADEPKPIVTVLLAHEKRTCDCLPSLLRSHFPREVQGEPTISESKPPELHQLPDSTWSDLYTSSKETLEGVSRFHCWYLGACVAIYVFLCYYFWDPLYYKIGHRQYWIDFVLCLLVLPGVCWIRAKAHRRNRQATQEANDAFLRAGYRLVYTEVPFEWVGYLQVYQLAPVSAHPIV